MKTPLVAATIAIGSFSCCCGSIFQTIAEKSGIHLPGTPSGPGASAELDGDGQMAGPRGPRAPFVPPATPPAPTTIASGPLTAEAILATADLAAPFEPWDYTLAVYQSKLGKPTRVDGERYAWAVMDGKDCVGTYMKHMTGPAMTTKHGSSTSQVGEYMGGQRFEGGSGNPYFTDCVKDAGGTP